MNTKQGLCIAVALAGAACSSTNDGKTAVEKYSPGVTLTKDGAIFKTADYSLDPGQEKFLCYAANFDTEFVAEGISHEARSSLHHIVFARATAPEPDGFSECDTLFRFTWEPVYLTGAGASSLDLPEGYGHRITAGTQMVLQLHLLNTSDHPVTDSVEIRLRRSNSVNPKPVAGYVFGNMDVHLPPLQPSTLEGDCELTEPVRLLAAFPHMHLLGKRLSFLVSHAGGAFSQTYERNPYNFDDQHLDVMDLELDVGDRTKVVCEYENTRDEEITFGESTMNEMCFFVGFAADREHLSGCMAGPPKAAAPAADAGP